MIAFTTQKSLRYYPEFQGGKEQVVLYYRPASITERGMFEAELESMNAGAVYDWNLAQAFMEGLKALSPDMPEEVDRISELYRRGLGQNDDSENPLTDLEVAEVLQVKDIVIDKWPPFQMLFKRQARRQHILSTLAVRTFMTGFENLEGKDGELIVFKSSPDGMVVDDVLACLEPHTMKLFGHEIYRNMYGMGMEKNSEPPLKSGGDQETLKAAKPGKSAKKSGAKTLG